MDEATHVCIADGCMARDPCWIEKKPARKLGWRLHLMIVNGPLAILFRGSVNTSPSAVLVVDDDLLISKRGCCCGSST